MLNEVKIGLPIKDLAVTIACGDDVVFATAEP